MKIALVGNQNSGKTTLFNLLTGMNSKIGNWPGVTVEKKTGYLINTNHFITDLPGIYSLSPYSNEENISKKYIFEENPDCIINIIDSTSLERSLYLTTQLLELDTKVIVVLNMADIIEKKGIKININNLEKYLGTKVIKISALKETGIDELINEINNNTFRYYKQIYDYNIEKAIMNISSCLDKNTSHKRFISVKLLEDDLRFRNLCNNKITEYKNEIINKYENDIEEEIATQRYTYIEKIKHDSFTKTKKIINISDTLDKIFLNKYLSFPIFIIIMFLIYYFSVGLIGNLTINFIHKAIDNFSLIVNNVLTNLSVSEWIISLLTNGIISGVSIVLSFIPQLIILFTFISILETTGYMSRIALLLDKIFRKIGLSGKSLIPFIIGSGCSVPGILGTRIIENEDERKLTTILTPFIPCSAKLPIIVLFSSYFFKSNAGLVSVSLYFLAIIIIILSAIVLKKFKFKKTSNTFISELPEYKLPSLKYVLNDVIGKVISFIKRAGSVILICSIIIWFLLSFSFKLEYGINIENSILSTIGKKISWLFYPMLGFDSWQCTVSAIQGLVAKEQVISSMNVISDITNNSHIFDSAAFKLFTPASAYAFMVFNLFSAPCISAISAMKKELGGLKKVLKVISFEIILSWFLSVIVYQIGYRIENKIIDIAGLTIIIIIIIVIIKIIKNYRKCSNCSCCKLKCNGMKLTK